MIKKICQQCKKEFFVSLSKKTQKNCSFACGRIAFSKTQKGHKISERTKRKIGLSNKGKIRTKEQIENHIKKTKGRVFGYKYPKGNIPWNKNKKTGIIPKTAFRPGVYIGEKHYNWKGGITPIRVKIYRSKEYQNWRNFVFKRDDYTCLNCGTKGCYLEAHHIKRWIDYPKLRYEIDNGVTLCKSCHNLTK